MGWLILTNQIIVIYLNIYYNIVIIKDVYLLTVKSVKNFKMILNLPEKESDNDLPGNPVLN